MCVCVCVCVHTVYKYIHSMYTAYIELGPRNLTICVVPCVYITYVKVISVLFLPTCFSFSEMLFSDN
jgi:hypothetical protein